MIEIKHLSKIFNDKTIFSDISFNIQAGEVYVIIGPSGTGKSTLLRCLNLLETPEQGELTIQGRTINLPTASKEEARFIREHISMVFQNFNLYRNKTALENITEPLTVVKGVDKQAATIKAEELLTKVNMTHRRDAYPVTLSGGEQQRIGIARAMGMASSMILFDEPTSALDPGLVTEVLGVIQQLAAERITMLIVTHEMQFARKIADQIIFMEAGEIVEMAPPDVLFTQPKDDRTRRFLRTVLDPGGNYES